MSNDPSDATIAALSAFGRAQGHYATLTIELRCPGSERPYEYRFGLDDAGELHYGDGRPASPDNPYLDPTAAEVREALRTVLRIYQAGS